MEDKKILETTSTPFLAFFTEESNIKTKLSIAQ